MVNKQLDELRTRLARLVAERDGLPRLVVPAELATRSDEATVKTLLMSEKSLFSARANARRSQTDLLQSRIAQLGEEIAGLDAQVDSKTKATGTDRRRTFGSSGALRQAARARDTAYDLAARECADRRRTRTIDFVDRRDKIQDRRGAASDRTARSGFPHRCREGTRRDSGQGSRIGGAWRCRAGSARSDRNPRTHLRRNPPAFRPHHRRCDPRRRHHHGNRAGLQTISRSRRGCRPTISTRCEWVRRRSSASRPSTSA